MGARLNLDERLSVLRNADTNRKWHSLDDERVCVICERVFTGRQIDIRRNRRGYFFLRCPTEGCLSDIRHWLYHPVVREQAPKRHLEPEATQNEVSFMEAA